MNLRHPYEQLIADKLKKLPVPDADASWQQMKRLLDDDDQDTGAGGNRPPGNNGWWRIGIIAIVLSASLWLFVQKTTAPDASISKANTTSSANNKTAAIKSNPATNNKITSDNNQKTTIDNTTTLPVSKTNTASAAVKTNDKTTNAPAADKSIIAGTLKSNTKHTIADDNAVSGSTTAKNTNTVTGNNSEKNAVKDLTSSSGKKDAKNNGLALDKTFAYKKHHSIENTSTSYSNHDKNDNDAGIAGNNKINTPVANSIVATQGYTLHNNSSKQKQHSAKQYINVDKKFIAAENNTSANGTSGKAHYLPVNQNNDAAVTKDPWNERLNQLKVFGSIPASNTALLSADSAEHNRNISNLLNPETKKLGAKAQRDKALAAADKKDKKSLHLNLSNLFKPFSLHMDAEPRWAAGIALNSGITLNAQNRYNYNMNAKSNTISDYIPSVYLQFHLNDYVYAQTEINFVSPQYTPQLLVYQQSNLAAQPGSSVQKTISVEKLYYFSLPVSFHYSPINNLYFSAGLQFSSFQSGLASIQEKQYVTQAGLDHPSIVSNSILKFKDDSIAAKIAPNEWRWQAGAEYYWNRFTIGLRYNQAFKQAINVNVNSTLSPTVMRNQSLIFFMRYNLFESRKKGETPQKN